MPWIHCCFHHYLLGTGTLLVSEMSQAFVKESDGVPIAIGRLHDVGLALTSLIQYLTRENNGVRVHEKKRENTKNLDREVRLMSNGLSYSKDEAGKWYIVE